ncbi:MAG: 1-acyl-sn-glycerol-3-phosphate acyltransferase [Bacteroidales bacterium]|uniref:1-acyl-sn-glycerol-3-phosphate acyltransferase n=1 Tax=Porphyromonas sp. TaxID=1924944 RepID=UPI0029755E96|nr:1-acyl-sn-glycerol-3-phosphate acyltransferase [Porphyromonas sp.]MDD7437997.1 1-acyl-sn-glycerol-3-phosphate acyltransferase [Bacteroidales bacterium]MDY3067437.1 hypothetical protein [Porphyromonas sp.]
MSKGLINTGDAYFESIRPYLDSEVQEGVQSIMKEEMLVKIMKQVYGEINEEQLKAIVAQCHTIFDFKVKMVKPVLDYLLKHTTFSLTMSGKSKMDRSGAEKYLFISNHRDIILDSAFLNYLCIEAGLPLPRIAIGDNLLITDWIRAVVRLCDAFIVKRHPSMREMLLESKRLSSYIRSSVSGNEASAWLAQSEGRRKNSDDRTQTAVLKMLTLSADKEQSEQEILQELKITPISITYEYDPCDYLKAREMLAKKLDPEWKKSPMDDMINMQTGLMGQKGRIHFSIGDTLRDLSVITRSAENKQEVLDLVAKEIDCQIFTNYRFYPNNYIAFDLLHGGRQFEKMYSPKEEQTFTNYLEEQIKKVEASEEHYNFVKERILEMYSMPLKNHLVTTKQIR